MLCCLTAPAPTLSLNINHHYLHWVQGWAGKYCWHWHRSLLATGPVLGSVITHYYPFIATQALLSAVGNESFIFVSTYNEDEVTLYWLVVARPKYRKERGDKIKAEREDRKGSGQEGWGWKTWRRMVEDYIVTMFMFIFQWNIELRRVACCLSFEPMHREIVEQTVSVPTTVILRHIT